MAQFRRFNDLPVDLKAQIIEKLLRPTDLKNACLVNKQLHELAVKPLYRSVSLDLGQPNDTCLSAFLNPRNIGLKYVRQMRLYLAKVPDACNQAQMATFATRMIVEMLPEDVLEEFSWCPWQPFSTANLLLLYQKQRKMKWLEVMNLDCDLLPQLKKKPKLQDNMFGKAKRLALYPENEATLNLSGFVVEKMASVLEELIVHCKFQEAESNILLPGGLAATTTSIPTRRLQDTATSPGLISKSIFGFLGDFSKCSPLPNLTSLRLHCISLRHCADTWCRFADFTNVKHIRLYQCPGADSFFGQLSRANHLPRQLKALEIQHEDNNENETLIALDGFLVLVSGLRDLVVDMQQVKSLPAPAGIVRHAKTLEMLSIHGNMTASPIPSSMDAAGPIDEIEVVYDCFDFEKICKACTKLEQLSCAWPQTGLLKTKSTEWKNFEMICFNNLKQLVTLHITTWPNCKPGDGELARTVYEHLLQGLATSMFTIARSPDLDETAFGTDAHEADHVDNSEVGDKSSDNDGGTEPLVDNLRLIAFGISDKVFEREDSKHQVIYLRSTYKDSLGTAKPYAAPIGWCLRQFMETRSNVLDYALQRQLRMPCKDSDRIIWPLGADDDAGWGNDG